MDRIIRILTLLLCVILLALRLGERPARALGGGQGAIVTGNLAPSPEQIQSLIARAVENQHRNDQAMEEFERVEHMITRKGENAEIVSDVTERVLPSGNGNIKLKIADTGVPVSPEEYRRALESAVSALDVAMHPNDRYKQDLVKFERRRHDRAELVDAAPKAFHVTWAGRETRPDSSGAHGSRTLMKLLLDPDPNFTPATRLASIFQHIHATLWVDESQAQFARFEADVASDIMFAGGVAGKIYHGGHFVMEQEEAAPGVWLPSLYIYDVDGRKFLFAFGVHERTEVTHYRRVGPPAQAIEILRNELNNRAGGFTPAEK